MKLIIQIPCYNEEKTLPEVIRDLPSSLVGVDTIEYLVIDDGSSDRTIEVAREVGVHHILPLATNRGLASAFMAGIRQSVELGADIIVNTDGDNQYCGDCIADLIGPVLSNEADLVIGARPIEDIDEFSWLKKKLQRIGSGTVRKFSGTDVTDTTSGFRAYTADTAFKLHLFNRYTYTLETIIQAGAMDIRIANVPIRVNPKTRDSRLMKSLFSYIKHSSATILWSYVRYKPMRFFSYLALGPMLASLGIGMRFIYFFVVAGEGEGKVQSLLLGTGLSLIGFYLFVLGVLAELIRSNRQLIQVNQAYLRKAAIGGEPFERKA